jgi:hypothetical protein
MQLRCFYHFGQHKLCGDALHQDHIILLLTVNGFDLH